MWQIVTRTCLYNYPVDIIYLKTYTSIEYTYKNKKSKGYQKSSIIYILILRYIDNVKSKKKKTCALNKNVKMKIIP